MPTHFYTFHTNSKGIKDFKANIDEWGFPCMTVDILNPFNGKSIENVKAILDTGAAGCLIQETVATFLELTSTHSSEHINPRKGRVSSQNHIVDIVVDVFNETGGCLVKGLSVSTFPDINYPSALIIGIDFLKYCSFQYDGTQKLFQLQINL